MSAVKQLVPDTASGTSPRRVMLISTPRSVSTAVMKCMSCIEDSLVFLEPYLMASWFGRDKKFDNPFEGFVQQEDMTEVFKELEATNIDYGYDVTEISYNWCKSELEKEYPEKKLIFCKEMAIGVRDHYEDLPVGFRYMFLIRNPMLVFPSWKKTEQRILRIPMDDMNVNKWTEAMIPQCNGSVYEEMCNQFEFVSKNRDPNPIVIDADDLLGNPSKILKACFEEINMAYSDSMLQWDTSDSVTRNWKVSKSCMEVNEVSGMYREAIGSGNFFAPKQLPNPNDLTEDERQFALNAMPFYERLHQNRIK